MITLREQIARTRAACDALIFEAESLDRMIHAAQSAHASPTIRRIQEAVCAHFDIPPHAMIAPGRVAIWAHPRQLAMALAHHLTGETADAIGAAFGRRNRKCVTWAVDQISNRVETEPKWSEHWQNLIAVLAPLPPKDQK